MSYQPKLCDELVSFSKMNFLINHSCKYFNPSVHSVDGTHLHGFYEIYFNLSGDVSFFYDDAVYRVVPGDVVLSFPGDVHCCLYNKPSEHNHFCLWFHDETVGNFLARRGARGLIRLSNEQKERLRDLLEIIAEQEIDPFIRSASFSELISLLGQGLPGHEGNANIPDKLKNILKYIDESFITISGTREITELFFLSEPTLNRLFRDYVGLSVHKLIEAKRLSYAEGLLRSGKSVTEACYDAGFSDCSRFISKFKDKFGKTPLQYKTALRCTKSN